VKFLKEDILRSAGSLQLCAGQESGCEAIIHAMDEIYKSEPCEGILLIDADNAFNRLNRSVALKNIQIICPPISTFAINCYRNSSRMFVHGGAEISSQEGTTQGDPLSMPLYALAITPLIQKLKEHVPVQQAWYADDAQGAGKLFALRRWWNFLVENGPGYGYYPNSTKTILVVKSDYIEEAKRIFDNTGVIIREGTRDLGAAIGDASFTVTYIEEKVEKWCETIRTLSQLAISSPQAAYSVFTHALKYE
jgi:hypothetical protein